MSHTIISLFELITKAKKHLDQLSYAESTQKNYELIWNHFLEYSDTKGQVYFSKKLGNEFLKAYYQIQIGKRLSASQVFKVRAITILSEILEHNSFLICHQKPSKASPQQFHNVLTKYEAQQVKQRLSKETIFGKKNIIVRFLDFLDKQGITELKSLTSSEVLLYLNTLDKYSNQSRSGILFTLRNFLLFLHSEEVTKSTLHDLFPVIFTQKNERLPSYYSTKEINSILRQVDRNTEFGRRDYLVLLLAIQLGMRAGDIRQLKFTNIKISQNTIEFVQQKTNKALQLPFTNELKCALADYAKNSRPQIDDPHIFVRHRAPFQPFANGNSFHHILNKYMKLAGIEINNRKHGLHSMRHSVASHLLQNNTPYPVITGILGHENASTTKLYLRIDIHQLRTVALEVPNEK